MKYRCSCGFEYCLDDGTPTYCGSDMCINAHYDLHQAWELAQSQSNVFYWFGTSDSTSFNSNTHSKWCPSCEQRYNVTDHVCKAIDKSKDFIDVMLDLQKRDKK